MKLTETRLKTIIKEEIQRVLVESAMPGVHPSIIDHIRELLGKVAPPEGFMEEVAARSVKDCGMISGGRLTTEQAACVGKHFVQVGQEYGLRGVEDMVSGGIEALGGIFGL